MSQEPFTTRKKRLLWRRLLRRHCWLRNDSTSTVWNVSAAFPARHAPSHTVCALQANLRDSKTDCKIRTRLAEGVKNKNDPGWDRLPPVLRHPTVLYKSCHLNMCHRKSVTVYLWLSNFLVIFLELFHLKSVEHLIHSFCTSAARESYSISKQ